MGIYHSVASWVPVLVPRGGGGGRYWRLASTTSNENSEPAVD